MNNICVLYEPFLQESQVIVQLDGKMIPYYGLSTEKAIVELVQGLAEKYNISDIKISAPTYMFEALSEKLLTDYSKVKITELERI